MAKLYIVPTPIGNLDDITLRAVNVLREVDFILAEDTRTTSFLLKHLGIEQKLRSHHKFNEHATVEMVAGAIAAGRNAALVSGQPVRNIIWWAGFSSKACRLVWVRTTWRLS